MRWRELVDNFTVKWINWWKQRKVEAFLKRVEPYMDAHIAKSKKRDAKDLKNPKFRHESKGGWCDPSIDYDEWSKGSTWLGSSGVAHNIVPENWSDEPSWKPTSDRLDDV